MGVHLIIFNIFGVFIFFMDKVSIEKAGRLDVVDALRGFAIIAIMLLHNLEHFDFYFFPEFLPQWVKAMDKVIWDTLFFLFAGKSYSIFALLFGLTYYIMFSNQQAKGRDFRWRFVWRMFLLLLFALVNSAFYQGDILTFYAVLGLALIPVSKWSNRAVLVTALLLLFQPLEWISLIKICSAPDITPADPASYYYFGKAGEYITGNSFLATVYGNLTNGKTAVVLWNFESGRIFQTPALFMFGMLLGRLDLFRSNKTNIMFWKRTFYNALAVFAVFYAIKLSLPYLVEYKSVAGKLDGILTSWSNFAFTFVWVSLFVLAYNWKAVNKVLSKLQPFGRMSLTNYVMQSVIGSFIYYGFGLALYQYTGASLSLLIGILLFAFQYSFSRWWMKSHTHGPLEGLWHRFTWIKL